MIKNSINSINGYTEARRQATQVYNQAVAYIKQNYKEGSALYDSAMKTARSTMEQAIDPVRSAGVKQVKKDFESTREAIRKAVAVAPSPELMTYLPLIREGKLTEAELSAITGQFKGNYMNEKLIADALGEHFTTVEGIMEQIDFLEAPLTQYVSGQIGSDTYKGRIISKGDWIQSVDADVTAFLTAYGQKEGEA